MITTLTEVKTLLQLSDTTYDAFITAMIPIAQDTVIQYCKNHFVDRSDAKSFYGGVTFEAGDGVTTYDTITGDFEGLAFQVGEIYISGSQSNDGYYTVTSADDTTITLESSGSLNNFEDGNMIQINQVKWATGLKMTVANLINFELQKMGTGIKSEKIGEYSITFKDTTGIYPSNIMGGLNNYRRVSW